MMLRISSGKVRRVGARVESCEVHGIIMAALVVLRSLDVSRGCSY